MKTILHLCADVGSDSYPYQLDSNYEVIKIGKKIGVENYHPEFLHKSAINHIPEFEPFKEFIDSDNAFRSLCSQGFANAFKEMNP